MVLLARHVKPGLRNEGLGYIMGVEGCEIGGIGLKPQGLLILILLGAGWLVTTGLTKLMVLERGFAGFLLELIALLGLELLVIHLALELRLIKLLGLLVALLFLIRLVILLLLRGPVLLLALGLVVIVLLGG